MVIVASQTDGRGQGKNAEDQGDQRHGRNTALKLMWENVCLASAAGLRTPLRCRECRREATPPHGDYKCMKEKLNT